MSAWKSCGKPVQSCEKALFARAFRLYARELLLQRRHVNHEAILHVALHQAFVGFVDFLNGDDLDVGDNAMFRTEVEHLLRLPDAPDPGTGKLVPSKNQAERRNR